MINRLTGVTAPVLMNHPARSDARPFITRDSLRRMLSTAHHALTLIGIGAIAAWIVLFIKPEIADRLKAVSPFTEVAEPAAEIPVVGAPPLHQLMDAPSPAYARAALEEKAAVAEMTDAPRAGPAALQQQRVTNWLSRRYRVAQDAVGMLVSASYETAHEMKLDPLLILSVVAIESRFNPFAESPMGAQGLMQVMSKIHHDKFKELGGPQAALNPVANIKVGSLILKEYLRRTGSMEGALKMYVGASDWNTEAGYGAKVLAEYQRLKEVAAGQRVPITSGSNVPIAVKAPAPAPQETLPPEAEASPTSTHLLEQNSERVTAL